MPIKHTATCMDIILAIILPPLGVFLRFGCKDIKLCPRIFVHRSSISMGVNV
ncbi:hypothetical protein L1049_020583 [Liquidambar formosana]|uniref:Uncharacterized protein n=1 Tax=Liquidambar formosana TaxID=63359 RepID=A0AAP0S7D7_LIQFO